MEPIIRVTLALMWRVGDASPTLNDAALERLPSYITRYAQTMGVKVDAVGGTTNHLHIAHDLPLTLPLSHIVGELMHASARFLQNTMKVEGFAWGAYQVISVGPDDVDALGAYITNNADHHQNGNLEPDWEWRDETDSDTNEEPLPDWLRQAMKKEGQG